MRLRVIIADDELLARQRLRRLLEQQPEVEILKECATGKETLLAIQELSPDLVMMDVCMPDMGAFEVIEGLGAQRVCAIVLVTAHANYALRAFDAQTLDYLLKPFDAERLKVALGRARELVERARTATVMESALDAIGSLKKPQSLSDRITVKSNGRITLLKRSEIAWVQSANNYCELHIGSKSYLIRKSLGALAAELPAERFVQISRSLLINVEFIRELRPKTHGDYAVVLRDGKELNASRNFRSQLLTRMGTTG